MKLVKSLLLGSAAGLVAVAGAQAADLPTKKSAPVEYVRVCDAYGAGFFYIPGTQTCLRVSGRIRAEYTWLNTRTSGSWNGAGAITGITSARAKDQTGFRARGRLNIDARTQTSWGTLRTYIRYEITRNSGVYLGGNTGPGGVGSASHLSYGFIQFAGITAGRAQSFYDFYADTYNYETLRDSDAAVNMLAYTATFGGGFSATLSLEDKNERLGALASVPAGNLAVPAFLPGGTVGYSGYRSPDLVAALRVDQGWGSAQLSGVIGRRNTMASNAVGAASRSYTAWALQAGVQIKLPMLAAGDELWIQGAYANGSLDYIGVGPNNGTLSGGFLGRFQGGLLHNDFDAIAVGLPLGGYSLERTKGWTVMAALQHYWAPSFRQVVMLNYTKVNYGAAANTLLGDASEWRAGTQLIWSPVSGFDIGLELMYAKLKQDLPTGLTPAALAAAGLKKNPSAYEARIRLQRDF
ncbi:MAG: porin [Rhizobiales bacterium]|nr:porin [Hyphomicrobiales bacterium]